MHQSVLKYKPYAKLHINQTSLDTISRSTCTLRNYFLQTIICLWRRITKRLRCHKAVLQNHRFGGNSFDDAEVDILVVNAASSVVTSNLNLVEFTFSNGASRGEAEKSSSIVQDRAIIFGWLEKVDLLLTLQARLATT